MAYGAVRTPDWSWNLHWRVDGADSPEDGTQWPEADITLHEDC